MTFDILQFHCKSEHKQVKRNKIKQDIWKSDSVFPNLQGIKIFEGFAIHFWIRFISK